jgi:hypothetical protein
MTRQRIPHESQSHFILEKAIKSNNSCCFSLLAYCNCTYVKGIYYADNFERNQFDSMKLQLSSTIPTIYTTLKYDIIISKWKSGNRRLLTHFLCLL